MEQNCPKAYVAIVTRWRLASCVERKRYLRLWKGSWLRYEVSLLSGMYLCFMDGFLHYFCIYCKILKNSALNKSQPKCSDCILKPVGKEFVWIIPVTVRHSENCSDSCVEFNMVSLVHIINLLSSYENLERTSCLCAAALSVKSPSGSSPPLFHCCWH